MSKFILSPTLFSDGKKIVLSTHAEKLITQVFAKEISVVTIFGDGKNTFFNHVFQDLELSFSLDRKYCDGIYCCIFKTHAFKTKDDEDSKPVLLFYNSSGFEIKKYNKFCAPFLFTSNIFIWNADHPKKQEEYIPWMCMEEMNFFQENMRSCVFSNNIVGESDYRPYFPQFIYLCTPCNEGEEKFKGKGKLRSLKCDCEVYVEENCLEDDTRYKKIVHSYKMINLRFPSKDMFFLPNPIDGDDFVKEYSIFDLDKCNEDYKSGIINIRKMLNLKSYKDTDKCKREYFKAKKYLVIFKNLFKQMLDGKGKIHLDSALTSYKNTITIIQSREFIQCFEDQLVANMIGKRAMSAKEMEDLQEKIISNVSNFIKFEDEKAEKLSFEKAKSIATLIFQDHNKKLEIEIKERMHKEWSRITSYDQLNKIFNSPVGEDDFKMSKKWFEEEFTTLYSKYTKFKEIFESFQMKMEDDTSQINQFFAFKKRLTEAKESWNKQIKDAKNQKEEYTDNCSIATVQKLTTISEWKKSIIDYEVALLQTKDMKQKVYREQCDKFKKMMAEQDKAIQQQNLNTLKGMQKNWENTKKNIQNNNQALKNQVNNLANRVKNFK